LDVSWLRSGANSERGWSSESSTEDTGVNLPADEGLQEKVNSTEGRTWSWRGLDEGLGLFKGVLGLSAASASAPLSRMLRRLSRYVL
jgi:hypothetical protein